MVRIFAAGTNLVKSCLSAANVVHEYARGVGMGPSELAARNREYAAKCIALAQNQDVQTEKLWLINMAQSWIDLVDQALRNEGLQVVFETPET